MGMSTVTASAILMIIFVGGLSVFILTTNSAFTMLDKTINQKTETITNRINEEITVTGFKRDNATDLRLNMTNTGETSILIRKIDELDIITTYQINSNQNTNYIQYDQTGLSSNFWKINRVFYKGAVGDLINPIQTSSSQGLWDPDECLEIRIHIADSTWFTQVTIASVNGVTASTSLTLEEQGGSIILPRKDKTVWVHHDLGRVPDSITVTPTLETDKHWVSQWNQTHFKIQVKKDKDYDVLFYWYAR